MNGAESQGGWGLAAELAGLERLCGLARRQRVRSGGPKVRGRGVEFGSYRGYVSGDDLRHIDWALYARWSRLVVKLTEETPEPEADLLIDTSGSMACGSPPVFSQALKVAAGLGAIALGRGAKLRVCGAPERLRGSGRLLTLIKMLERLRPGGPGAKVQDAFNRRGRLLVLAVTDGLSAEFAGVMRRLRHVGREVFCVHVQPRHELAPRVLGPDAGRGAELDLRDAESGSCVRRFVDDEALAAMVRKREDYLREREGELTRLGFGHARIWSDVGIQALLRELLELAAAGVIP